MKKLFYAVLVFSINSNLYSISSETLPTHHWSYEIISEFQTRGYLLELSQMSLPYSRIDIAREIINYKNFFNSSNSLLESWLADLEQEFYTEIMQLNDKSNQLNNHIIVRSKVNANLDKNDLKTEYKGIYRGGVGVNFTDNIFVFSGVNFNQYDLDNPDYAGYEWRGITGYTEQAYISYQNDRFALKFGRDFIKWGTGIYGTLVMSDIARPIDQLFGSAKFGPFKFSFFMSELDEFGGKYVEKIRVPVRRYLSGHRLEVNLFKGKLQASISELMLYGGIDETFDLVYSNPFVFWHGANYNNKSNSGNVLPTVDLLFYPMSNWKIYGSLLIDDIQVEKTGPGDLEPNEIGLIVGSEYAEPFDLRGLAVNAEYVRVANRTYKTPNPIETFVNRNITMGHPNGNDFDQFAVGARYWLNSKIKTDLNFSFIRNGEGSIYSSWDAPWLEYTVEEGYNEPFPTGTVEKIRNFTISALWYYKSWARLNILLSSSSVDNVNNFSGNNDSIIEGHINIELNYDYLWNLGK